MSGTNDSQKARKTSREEIATACEQRGIAAKSLVMNCSSDDFEVYSGMAADPQYPELPQAGHTSQRT